MRLLPILLLCLYCLSGSANQVPTIEVDCDDLSIFDAVDEVLRSYNNEKEDGNLFVLYRITAAKIKHENDSLTHHFVSFEIQESVCAVKSGISWQECDFKIYEEDSGDCAAHVLVDTELKTKEVLSHNCSITKGGLHSREPVAEPIVTIALQPCVGCEVKIDSKELSPLVQSAIENMNRLGNHPFYFDLEDITKATRQVVSGWNYKLEYNVRQTNCSKLIYPNGISEECKLDANGQGGHCDSNVFVNPKGEIKDVALECFSSTGFCLSCPDQVESNDPELQILLKQFVEKYNSENNNTNLYKVYNADIATRKLVADTKQYTVEFKIQVTNCSRLNHSILEDDCAIELLGKQLTCKARIDVTNETVNILPDYTCDVMFVSSLQMTRVVLKGFSPLRSVISKDTFLVRRGRASEKSRGRGHGPNHKEEKHGKKEKKNNKDKGKKKHDHKKDHSSEESEEDKKKPEAPSRRPQYEIPKVPEIDVNVLVTTTQNRPVTDKIPEQPVTQCPTPFIPNLSSSSPLIPGVPEHQGSFPNIHETVLLDLPVPTSANVPKCPGKLWQPLLPVLQIPTDKPFIISGLISPVDDLTPPDGQDEMPSPNQPTFFTDADLFDGLNF